MARTPFRDIQQIESTALTEVYEAITGVTGVVTTMKFTNTTTSPVNISVYNYDGTTDFLDIVIHLPAGIGRQRIHYGFERDVLETGDIIKVQADAANAFNLKISGSTVEVAS